MNRKQSSRRKAKTNQKTTGEPQQRVFTKSKIAIGLLTVLLGVLGWLLSTCISERRNALQEFKKASRLRRIAIEKLSQASLAADSTAKYYNDYLKRDDVRLKEIKLFQNQYAASARNLNDSCNSFIQAIYEENAALRELSKRYAVGQIDTSEPLVTCSDSASLAADTDPLSNSDLLERLARDKSFRNELVRKETLNIERNSRLRQEGTQMARSLDESRSSVALNAEAREASLRLGVWDCLCSLFGKP